MLFSPCVDAHLQYFSTTSGTAAAIGVTTRLSFQQSIVIGLGQEASQTGLGQPSLPAPFQAPTVPVNPAASPDGVSLLV